MNPFIHMCCSKTLFTQDGPRDVEYDLEVAKGEMLGIFGPSGAGKSTLLRILAGLEKPDHGCIEVDGEVWFDSSQGVFIPPEKRRVGMVFQQPHLFPNMTIRQNLQFSISDGSDPQIAEELLNTFGLEELQHRKPHQLSGGQCQRAALARTLVNQPKILLLDEPFSSLDWSLRWKMQAELKAWHEKFQCTAMLVSHDLLEISRVANRILSIGQTQWDAKELEQAAEHYLRLSLDAREFQENSYRDVGHYVGQTSR